MKIVIIGSGNVASHLTKVLIKSGNYIVQVMSKTLENARELAQKYNLSYTNRFSDLDHNADLYIVSVSDDAIEKVVDKLLFVTSAVVHTSGTTSIEVLKKLKCNYGVFYPLQTFSKNKEVDFKNIPVCLESNHENWMLEMKGLASLLSDKVFEVSSEKRKILHVAAVFACNFSNHMMALSQQLLGENKLSFELISPLIKETFEKSVLNGPLFSQTGPAIRNDKNTMMKHLDVLQNQPKLAELYKIVSDSIYLLHKKDKL